MPLQQSLNAVHAAPIWRQLTGVAMSEGVKPSPVEGL